MTEIDSGRMMHRWWVYENRVHDRAVVHYYKCSFCKDGKGLVEDSSKDRGVWQGPYPTVVAAIDETKRLKRGKSHICHYCKKYLIVPDSRVRFP